MGLINFIKRLKEKYRENLPARREAKLQELEAKAKQAEIDAEYYSKKEALVTKIKKDKDVVKQSNAMIRKHKNDFNKPLKDDQGYGSLFGGGSIL